MNEIDHRFESMLFDYGSTTLTDFRDGRILPKPPPTVYRAPPVNYTRPCYKPLKDFQTLEQFNERVPFDLFVKPKEILQTNPRKVQEYQMAYEDLEREEVRKTRPRVVLTPEVAIDDADEQTRRIVLEDKYKSTFQKDYCFHPDTTGSAVVSPLVPVPAPAKPVQFRKYVDGPMWPMVSPEWRWDSVSWDSRQLRCYCDPTKEFWTRGRPKDQLIGKY